MIIMNVISYDFAPVIAKELEKVINGLDNPEDYVLSLQFDYRDSNTLFYLEKVDVIVFNDLLIKIIQTNGSVAFFEYENIVEYCVINAKDVINIGGC